MRTKVARVLLLLGIVFSTQVQAQGLSGVAVAIGTWIWEHKDKIVDTGKEVYYENGAKNIQINWENAMASGMGDLSMTYDDFLNSQVRNDTEDFWKVKRCNDYKIVFTMGKLFKRKITYNIDFDFFYNQKEKMVSIDLKRVEPVIDRGAGILSVSSKFLPEVTQQGYLHLGAQKLALRNADQAATAEYQDLISNPESTYSLEIEFEIIKKNTTGYNNQKRGFRMDFASDGTLNASSVVEGSEDLNLKGTCNTISRLGRPYRVAEERDGSRFIIQD